jgi:Ca-activated chloride channel family protein
MRGKTAAFFLGLASLAALPAAAQAPPGPLPPRPGAKPQEPPQIRVRVDLVTTPVTVRAASTGELVIDLEAKDFRVFDNGVEQKIERFDLGGQPLSLALVFETSSRVEPLLPAVRKSGILFTQTVLGEDGEAAIVTFDDDVNVVQPFSKDHDLIEKSVANLRLGTSGARLYDALSRSVTLLRNLPQDRRRVIFVVAEPKDTGSESALGEVLRAAQLEGISIYSVVLSTTAAMLRGDPQPGASSPTPPGTFGRPGIPGSVQTPTTEQQRAGNINLMALARWLVERAASTVTDNSLEVAAAATGGMPISTFRDRSIERAISEIGGELHQQFMLSYRPAGVDSSGFHEIEIKVKRPGLRVRARQGYYLSPP